MIYKRTQHIGNITEQQGRLKVKCKHLSKQGSSSYLEQNPTR